MKLKIVFSVSLLLFFGIVFLYSQSKNSSRGNEISSLSSGSLDLREKSAFEIYKVLIAQGEVNPIKAFYFADRFMEASYKSREEIHMKYMKNVEESEESWRKRIQVHM